MLDHQYEHEEIHRHSARVINQLTAENERLRGEIERIRSTNTDLRQQLVVAKGELDEALGERDKATGERDAFADLLIVKVAHRHDDGMDHEVHVPDCEVVVCPDRETAVKVLMYTADLIESTPEIEAVIDGRPPAGEHSATGRD